MRKEKTTQRQRLLSRNAVGIQPVEKDKSRRRHRHKRHSRSSWRTISWRTRRHNMNYSRAYTCAGLKCSIAPIMGPMTHAAVCWPVPENPSNDENLSTPQIEIGNFNDFKRKRECINSRSKICTPQLREKIMDFYWFFLLSLWSVHSHLKDSETRRQVSARHCVICDNAIFS